MPLTKKQKELFLAVYDGDVSKVECLLSSRVKPNCLGNKDRTPLHVAAYVGNAHTVELLLKAGADVNARDIEGKIPLYFAAWIGNAGIAGLLLNAGSDPNSREDCWGRTPLLFLSETYKTFMSEPGRDYPAVIRLMIAAGADIKAKDRVDHTVLMRAAIEGNLVLLKLFVKHGADLSAKSNDGRTVLEFARDKECREWLLGLEKAGTDDVALDHFLPNDFPSGGKDGL